MASAGSNGGVKDEGIDFKYPSWDGEWSKWTDYLLRVELRTDGMKEDERTYLGPRLASNLTGRAFDSLAEINRDELRKPEGWRYLVKFLEGTRGKEKVDLLGDAFHDFFIKKEVYRRENEELGEYEHRFKLLQRRLDKAVADSGSDGKVPSELLGWLLLNCYMKMDPSDVANVRGRATSYKLADVWSALQRMWSGGGLAAKDAEMKRKRRDGGQALHVADDGLMDTGAMEDEAPSVDQISEEPDQELTEAAEWYQEALAALVEEPEDGEILVNFKEARRALGQAKTSRGFYPVRPPGPGRGYNNFQKGKGKGKGYAHPQERDDRTCVRCGKKGHIAKFCPQKREANPRAQGNVGYIGMAMAEMDTIPENEEIYMSEAPCPPSAVWTTGDSGNLLLGKAVLDSGASDNVIGVDSLQDLSIFLQDLGFDSSEEVEINRTMHKNFVFGSDHSGKALGLAHLNLGILGEEMSLEVHVIEGTTPLLLSAKFLYDVDASINFRTGVAVFQKLGEKPFLLERGPGNHLLLPVTAYGGRRHLLRTVESSDLHPAPAVLNLVSEEAAEATTTKGEPHVE